MKTLLAACACSALALAACVTQTPEPNGPGGGDDCAVIAAVAKEHYGWNAVDRPGPRYLYLGEKFSPACDWTAWGVAFDGPFDRGAAPAPDQVVVSFSRPTYDGQGAILESDLTAGPMVGSGVRCRLRSGFAGWTVDRCEQSRIY